MGERAIYFIAGAVIGYFLLSRTSEKKNYLKTGDKGKDVADLQNGLNRFAAANLQNIGVYDKRTAGIVRELFKGTRALKDPDSGKIEKNFAHDFSIIVGRL